MPNYLVIPPIGTNQVWTGLSSPPSAGQVPPNSKILVLADNYIQSQVPFMQSDGKGNAVYVAPAAPPPDPPGPDLRSFIEALRAEKSFTSKVRINLASLLTLLQLDINNPQNLQQDWQDAIAVNQNNWLTNTVQTVILGFAKTYNIPLV